MMVIMLVALIAVGPEQLPTVMRKVGRYVSQLRSMADGVRGEFMSGMGELDPTKWGEGTDDKPIVPRGYAESAVKTTLDPGANPVAKPAQPSTIDAAFGNAAADSTPESATPESASAEIVPAETAVDTTPDDTTPDDAAPADTAPADAGEPGPIAEHSEPVTTVDETVDSVHDDAGVPTPDPVDDART